MPAIKVTSWNVEWLDTLYPKRTQAGFKNRWEAIVQEVRDIAPDILCVVEGIRGRTSMRKFVDALGSPYKLVELRTPSGGLAADAAYKIQGKQWIWFVVNQNMDPAPSRLELLQPDAWFAFTQGKTWKVSYWGDFKTSNHDHYRTPQVLIAEWPLPGNSSVRVDFVGLHLKSKHINKSVSLADWATEPANAKKKAYIVEALKARIKLATEALDVRRYIDSRFEQAPEPAVVLLGDLNDGPGKELFENQFLFFDLVSNLQGDVFFSTRFLNHALFDYAENLRWSCHFKDKLDPDRDPHILLDHILFTQGLTDDRLAVTVKPHAGFVEHSVHDGINALLPASQKTSDHKPVSCHFEFS